LPFMDAEAMVKDVEWHNRPDYGHNLFMPDGVERDQYRFERGVEVIRANPLWFTKGLFSRMAFMLRYNDFRPQNNATFTSIAPTVLARPPFGHSIAVGEDAVPMWAASADQMFAGGERLSGEGRGKLTQSGRVRLTFDPAAAAEHLSPPLVVKPETDYILTIPIIPEEGGADLKIRALDQRFTLQIKAIAPSGKRARTGKNRTPEAAGIGAPSVAPSAEEGRLVTSIQLPFSSGENGEVRFVIANRNAADKTILQAGEAQLFELGKTPYQWTRMPRSVARGLQKNIFKTDTMRLLLLLGILLLAGARRRKALLILLAVPLYYLGTHAPFSTEYRYILALHCFLFVVAATTLYVAGAAVREGVFKLWYRRQHRVAEEQDFAAPELG
jgi:hypothetical protein